MAQRLRDRMAVSASLESGGRKNRFEETVDCLVSPSQADVIVSKMRVHEVSIPDCEHDDDRPSNISISSARPDKRSTSSSMPPGLNRVVIFGDLCTRSRIRNSACSDK